MKVCDYGRSFVTFRIDLTKKRPVTVSQKPPHTLNNGRLQVDCLCRVTPPRGKSRQFVLSASCKGEQVNVTKGMWHTPSSDMCMVADPEEILILKSWDRNNKGVMLYPPSLGAQPERQVCRVADALDSLRIHLTWRKGTPLTTTRQIIAAVLDGRAIVGRTEFKAADGSRVMVEYPIKTINASERDHFYQVDTGPILLPEPGRGKPASSIASLQRAFIAHNSADYAEVIINVPTPLTKSISVNHYSKVIGLKVRNRLFALP